MNWSNRVVGGWWRNLKFGGWEVHYFEDGGWRMKVKNQNEILEQKKKFIFCDKLKCLFPVRCALGQSSLLGDRRHTLPPFQYP